MHSFEEVSSVRFSRGLCGRSATSIVAAYSRSFRLRRFASPLEKQSRLWRPVNSNQRFEYDRLVRGHNSRHWRESAHLPLDSFGFPSDEDVVFRRGLSGRPLHPFGRILLEGVNEWRVMIFPCNTQSLACKATAEGFQGAIGKPLGINIPKQDG